MPEYILTKRSQNDLKQIARYTDQRWGIKKRHEYLAQIESAFPKLAENPHFGRACPELKGTPYRYHVGRHYIFYRHNPEGITVIRVLHDSMDHKRHIK